MERVVALSGAGLFVCAFVEFAHARVDSWRELRDAGVVRQAFDYSCGAAALATLLSASGDPVTERDVLVEVFADLSDEQAEQTMEQGLSLLDLKRVAEQRGHAAEGYRIPAGVLMRFNQPALVLIQPLGYAHFVVLKGIRDGRAYLADPARGNVRMAADRFFRAWLAPDGKGIVFLLDARASGLLAAESTRPELLAARQLLSIGPRHPILRSRGRFP